MDMYMMITVYEEVFSVIAILSNLCSLTPLIRGKVVLLQLQRGQPLAYAPNPPEDGARSQEHCHASLFLWNHWLLHLPHPRPPPPCHQGLRGASVP